jgi:predicted Na+-dependent transporter
MSSPDPLAIVTTSTNNSSSASFGVVDILAMVLGVFVFGYGLLLVSASPLGGAWVAAIGLSLALAGLFATEWAGRRFGLSAADRRTLSLTFGAISVVLFASFVVVNYMGFEGPVTEGSTAVLGR